MKWKRRLTAALLTLSLLLALTPAPAGAASAIPRTPGRIAGIDYSRIDSNATLRRPIEITIGGRIFSGYLQNGALLSNEEVDAAIREVMAEHEVSGDDLYYAYGIIAQAAKTTGFDPDIIYKLGVSFAKGAVGLDNAESVYYVAVGEKEAIPTGANMAIGAILGKAAVKAFVKNVYAMVVSGLWNCTEPLGQEIARLLGKSELTQEAVAKSRALGQFYGYCNQRIEEKEKEKGVEGWTILCNQTVWCDKTLFGIKTLQYWRMSCDLRRTDYIYGNDDDPTNYGGVYRGTMVIDVWHDLSNFDAQFMNLVLSQTSLPVSTHFSRKHDDHSASSLTKRLMRTNVEIHLDQNNMTSSGMTEFFSLKDFDDTSAFVVDHTVTVPHPHNWWDENGYLDMTVQSEIGPVRIESNFWYKDVISGSLTYGNRYPELIYKNFSLFSDIKTSGAYSSYIGVIDDTQDYDFPIITDYQIFDDLRNNRGMLTVLGG